MFLFDLQLAIHRWSVTGTPIEKSIHNLYGLIYFLGCEPYENLSVWNTLTVSFLEGLIREFEIFLKYAILEACLYLQKITSEFDLM